LRDISGSNWKDLSSFHFHVATQIEHFWDDSTESNHDKQHFAVSRISQMDIVPTTQARKVKILKRISNASKLPL
jgi:hypothetical protein